MKELYFISLLVPSPETHEITLIRNELSQKFNCHHALKSPPHITLHMPFRLDPAKYDLLEKALRGVEKPASFHIVTGSIKHFGNRTIYIDVVENSSLSQFRAMLQDELFSQIQIPREKRHAFNPHITLANRDINPNSFDDMMTFLQGKTYADKFTVHEISLLKHNGEKWEICLSCRC